jgi:hypothetical protein
MRRGAVATSLDRTVLEHGAPRWQRPHLEIDGTGEPRYVMVAK